jgi:hypothetical protein
MHSALRAPSAAHHALPVSGQRRAGGGAATRSVDVPSPGCRGGGLEGPPKTNRRTPRVFAKSQTYLPNHLPTFFIDFFYYVFGRFSAREFKNTIQIFLQKVHVENFSQTNRQKNRCQFSLVFCFVAFSGLSQRWEFKVFNLFFKKI